MKKLGIRKIVNIIAVVALLIFLHFTKVLSPIENAFIFILDPLSSKLYSLSSDVRSYYSDNKENKNLANEVEILEEQINEVLSENARLKSVEKENRTLRQYLDFFESHEHDNVLVNVISRGGVNNADKKGNSIIIDKGEDAGIVPGLAVVDENGVIIGKIMEAKDKISEVILTTDPLCRLAVATNNANQARGLAEGELGLTIKMGYISQEDDIKINDVVVTSGLEDKIPEGLIVGRVIKVSKKSNEVWQSAVIEPLVDIESLNIVSVIIP